VIKENKTNRWA